MTIHLGYEKHDPAGRGSGNSRNGSTGKKLLTDVGAVELAVPRDPAGGAPAASVGDVAEL
jgi:transposase-like protein